MSWIDRLRGMLGRKAAVSAPISAARMPAGYGLLLMGSGRISARDCWALYKSVGKLAQAVDLIADSVASLVPMVKVNGEIVDGHPALALLARPGYSRTRRRLIKEVAVQYLVTGTGYLHVLGNIKGPPGALDVFKSKDVQTVEGGDGWPGMVQVHESRRSFIFARLPGRDVRFLDGAFGEIVPIYDMDGDDRGVGLPRLQAVQDDVNLKMLGLQHNRSLLANGARLSGVVNIKGNATSEQRAEVQRHIQSGLAGASNAGRVMITAGEDIKFENMTMHNRDMDWTSLMRVVDDSIVNRYNIPATLFNTDAQTYNNYSMAWRALYDNAVLPTFEIVYSAIARMLSERLGESIEIVHDALTNTVLADQAVERAKNLLAAQMITVNEARSIVGYEPLVGGDQIFGPPGMVGQYEDIFTDYGTAEPEPKEPADDAGKHLRLVH